ncbi:hypothetical protein HF072_05550 [Bacillus sp. RO3]|nr:hypothetical protein [Bacillus sp. RO3]
MVQVAFNKFRDGKSMMVASLILGVLLGTFAKYADGTVVGWIGTQLGVWVLIATFIVMASRTPLRAALHTLVFFLAMLMAYYIYSMILFGFFPTHYFLLWTAVALVSPFGAYMVWFARGKGWSAAFFAALPISVLVFEGQSFFYTFSIVSGFDIAAAILLFVLLPKDHLQRVRLLPVLVGLLVVFKYSNIFYLIPVMS